ncbi:MAG TPA: RNA polymerase sigma factor [Phycisphaerae bacterium]|nr:RNA polymerase sigma factor [Phycisphaerae bacterium]
MSGGAAVRGNFAPAAQAGTAAAEGVEDLGPLPADPREALAMHGSWLRAVAIARLRGLEGADDVMQDVAIAAIRNWETLRTAANAKPWLYRLTVRAALMHRRTLGRARKRIKEAIDTYTAKHGIREAAPRKSELGAIGTHGAHGGDPLGALLSSERHAQLRVAIAKLPVKDVEMLLLKHVDDCSYQEIARRLGVTAGVVQMRLFRARQKLREILLQQYPES